MFNKVKKSIKFGDHNLTIETGEIGRQADGAVVVSYGDTVVFVTVCGNKTEEKAKTFFRSPLINKKKLMLVGKYLAVFLNAKAGQVRKRH